MRNRPVSTGLRSILLGKLLLAVALLSYPAGTARAETEGLSYTLTPVYNPIWWDSDLGLEDTEFFGGRLGLHFGQMVSLQGYYLFRDDIKTRAADTELPGVAGDGVVDMRNYGADLFLGLGRGRIVPFLKAGGGVLQFEPAVGDDIKQIQVRAGAGVRFGIRRLMAELYAEDVAFRVNRYGYLPGGAESFLEDPEDGRTRHNLSVGAGLTLFLGGQRLDRMSETDRAVIERYRSGLSGISIPVVPFAGRMEYSDEVGLETHDVLGVRTGLDFGRYFGLRGYYWRGLEKGFDDTIDLQSFGGEAQFNLNPGRGVVPYLVLGAGTLDFMNDDETPVDERIDDRTMLILGGGVGFRVSDRIELDVAARDHVFSVRDLEKTSNVDELTSNWMFSAGLRLSIGGGGRGSVRDRDSEDDYGEMAAAPDPKNDETARTDWVASKGDDEDRADGLETDSDRPKDRSGRRSEVRDDERRGPWRPRDGMVTFPAPTEGEIYIRYGKPGGVLLGGDLATAESSDAEAGTAAQPGAAADQNAKLDESALRAIIREELRAAGLLRPAANERREDADVAARASEPRSSDPEREPMEPESSDGDGLSFAGIRPYVGGSFGAPEQFLIGGQLLLGGVMGSESLLLVPEFAHGSGDDATTFHVSATLRRTFGRIRNIDTRVAPYVGVGPGILVLDPDAAGAERETEFGINVIGGLDVQLGTLPLFVEYQGIKFFDRSRVIAGVRIR